MNWRVERESHPLSIDGTDLTSRLLVTRPSNPKHSPRRLNLHVEPVRCVVNRNEVELLIKLCCPLIDRIDYDQPPASKLRNSNDPADGIENKVSPSALALYR